jgi:hypothetical protein
MSGVVIAGDTSGSVTLQAPNVAGTTTLTLPTTSGTVALTASPTFTGQATIPTINLTGGQITFPATKNPSADANTLDDYEEGTWTPGINIGGSFTTAVGRYVKIGHFVFVTWELTFPSSSSSSSFEVTGLPFFVGSSCFTGYVGITTYGSADLCFFVHAGTSNIFVRNNSNSNLPLSAFSTRVVNGSAGYFVG